jgi:hypothetical protein
MLALAPTIASGQPLGVPIQLPSTSVFSVNTTVSVPDGGAISLGGNSGSAWSSTRSGGRFRPFGNRSVSGSQFASNATVHVQIISLAEMEAELLSQLPDNRRPEDYARPKPPEVKIHQAIHSEGPSRAEQAPLPNRPTQQLHSRAPARSSTSEAANDYSASPGATPRPRNKFLTETVDPNGSREVQDKADFMSRHIGRKKK